MDFLRWPSSFRSFDDKQMAIIWDVYSSVLFISTSKIPAKTGSWSIDGPVKIGRTTARSPIQRQLFTTLDPSHRPPINLLLGHPSLGRHFETIANICHQSLSNALPFPMTSLLVWSSAPSALPSSVHRFVLSEVKRVLRPGGYLEFSVLVMDLVNMGNRAPELYVASGEDASSR